MLGILSSCNQDSNSTTVAKIIPTIIEKNNNLELKVFVLDSMDNQIKEDGTLSVILFDKQEDNIFSKQFLIKKSEFTSYTEPITDIEKIAIIKKISESEIGVSLNEIKYVKVIFKTKKLQFEEKVWMY